MMHKPKRSARVQIVGKTATVTDATNKGIIGTEGKITDETRNTITIMTDKGTKTLIKEQITINIGGQDVDGKQLVGRIEERIKNHR